MQTIKLPYINPTHLLDHILGIERIKKIKGVERGLNKREKKKKEGWVSDNKVKGIGKDVIRKEEKRSGPRERGRPWGKKRRHFHDFPHHSSRIEETSFPLSFPSAGRENR